MGEIEFGGVGRGWPFAGTLLAATAVKLSRPKGLKIWRAEVAMVAIFGGKSWRTFLCRYATQD